jgi:hypothetical protein
MNSGTPPAGIEPAQAVQEAARFRPAESLWVRGVHGERAWPCRSVRAFAPYAYVRPVLVDDW